MMSSLDIYVSGQQPLTTLQTHISDAEENLRFTRDCVLILLEVLAQAIQMDLAVQEQAVHIASCCTPQTGSAALSLGIMSAYIRREQ